MTDQEIFEGIVQQDNQTFLYLYQKYKGQIINMVSKNSGNEEDALDVFQAGLVALWTNIERGKFKMQDQARISTYLYALCRNLWISKLRKRKIIHSIDDNPGIEAKLEVKEMEEEYDKVKALEKGLQKLGEACQKLLQLFYYQKASLREIALEMDITEKTAKNNKYRCMQNLRANFKAENSSL